MLTGREGWSRRLRERSNLTGAQFQVWLGQKLDPDVPLYNMAFAWWLQRDVSPERFDRAFARLVEECDALRTVVEETADGVPMQRVSSSVVGLVEHLDLSHLADPEAACRELLHRRCATPIDMAGPMFDAALVRLGPGRHVWYLAQHHLVTDAWSCSLLFRRMSELYDRPAPAESASHDRPPPFEGYREHEVEARRSPAGVRAERFWRHRAATAAPPVELFGRRVPDGALWSERHVLEFGTRRSDELRSLAARDGFRTLSPDLAHFNLWASVLAAWINRVGGGDRLTLGAPVSCRANPTLRDTPGLLLELLPLAIDVADDDTFTALAGTVARETRSALAHAVPGTAPIHAGGFPVVLNYLTATFGEFAGAAVRTEWVHCGACDRGHVVRAHVHDFDATGSLTLSLDLAREVLDADMRRATVGQVEALVDALLADPDRSIATVSLGGPPSRASAPADDDMRAAPRGSVLTTFRDRLETCRGDIALAGDGLELTFGDLESRATAMARALRVRGVGRGGRVALSLPRSPDAVAAMLAVLEAGAAYVPVDPSDPTARRVAILADADVDLVIVDASPDRVPAGARAPVVTVPQLVREAGDSSNGPPHDPPEPDDPAYVIYTSGSTGTPKGVVVRHRNLASYVAWAAARYAGDGPCTMPLFTSLSVDLSVTSIWVPLTTGGTVVIAPDRPDAVDLPVLDVVRQDRVDVLKLTPTHLSLVRDEIGDTTRLRTLVVGGENLRTELAAAVHRACRGRVEIVNEYGPTEATVGCTSHRFDARRDTGAHVPVGRPIAGATATIVDRTGNPVPAGVAGELVVGGAGVAAGYLGRPEASAERFRPDPHAEGATVYHTGDLARWSTGGDIEILGRIDRQLKIRGVRVEPAEIEARIVELTGVRECLVEAVPRARPARSRHHPDRFCLRCGLAADHPAASIDDNGVCDVCRGFEATRHRAMAYFRTPDELRSLLEAGRGDGDHDCIMMLSGGKDSTYALCRLVDMGLRVLAYTFDNGYISDTAMANNRRICDALGVELVVGTTPAIDEIFVESIGTYGGVCNGCFKALFVLALRLARERGVRNVVTGLSRAQLFATRLGELNREGVFDPDAIDRSVLDARRAYHRMDDAVARRLNGDLFDDGRIFDDVRLVDFYRYHDVAVDDMMEYLRNRVPWKRPSDTGCSTNCLINDVGIFVHRRLRGFHNYALPYSWEVRLGHKSRAEARRQLEKTLDMAKVSRILGEIGFDDPVLADGGASPVLVAVYAADRELDVADLRARLADHLPPAMIPADAIRVDAIPLDAGGKADRAALRRLAEARRRTTGRGLEPTTPLERTLATLWARALDLPPGEIGVDDDFFMLGGDSIMSIQIVAWAREEGLQLDASDLFSNPTVAALARHLRSRPSTAKAAVPSWSDTGTAPLTPVQMWCLEQQAEPPGRWNQEVVLELDDDLEPAVVQRALDRLAEHHAALRLRLVRDPGDGWRQVIDDAPCRVPLEIVELTDGTPGTRDERIAEAVDRLHGSIDPTVPPLLRAALLSPGAGRPRRLALAAHHLAVDAVSWQILLADLAASCGAADDESPPPLPASTTPFLEWARRLARRAAAPDLDAEVALWCERLAAPPAGMPADLPGGDAATGATATVSRTLSADHARALLHDAPALGHASVQEILLAAVAHALGRWGVAGALTIDVEGHGRTAPDHETDLTRTVGWLTSVTPVVLPIEPSLDPDDALQAAKDGLRGIAGDGLGFGPLRYLHPDPQVRSRLDRLHRPAVLFNYLGRVDRLLETSPRLRPVGGIRLVRGPDVRRRHALEVDAWVLEGRLEITWTFSPARFPPDTVEHLAERFDASLRELIDRCCSGAAGVFVPSDFPHADLGRGELDDILAELGGTAE